ncbi:fluoride efflux transporter FluC [Nocardioides astragali]|uniref:Fluoride-specific ion channel FluC n=1 Tax=Nocardioides astragali TaxID=1776736 RepID=A0ABW2N1L5_9ACTN|nr:CrcB family protein [Nocardioides astragali]
MSARSVRVSDLLPVAAGGAVGAVLRFGVDSGAPDTLFPWATMAINVVGAFALGALPALALVRSSRRVTLVLGPGVLGGFTTVSAWAGQTRALADDGHAGIAGLYLVSTIAVGLLAAALGQRIARRPEPDGALG